ncbi:unnamed protein product [Rotaria socialis]|uniref:FAD-binding domain-containing protein n=1 Tax=Rotaria socialis TaxID=392032 RepID=A0A817XVN0_9BILA|nr:unnamed protein product [Rotaria socialis]CAF4350734.1 unnamed protein product [Rotaria socialis]
MKTIHEQHFLSGKYIIVAGGGIGGLTFCVALQRFLENNNQEINPPPHIVVYERELSLDDIGREGYSLSIRSDPLSGGMQILQKLDLLDQILGESNPGTYFTVFNNDFTPLIEFQSPPVEGLSQSTASIARSKLREILHKNISPSIAVHWNHGIESVEELENGQVIVTLMNGHQEKCDLLIAADGSNSKGRRAIRSQNELRFAGAVSIAARTQPLEKLPPPIDKTWGSVLGVNGNFLFVAPSDQRSALWSVSYLSDKPSEPRPAGTMSEEEIEQVLSEAHQRLVSFGEPMPTLFKKTLRSSVSVFNAKDMEPFRNHGSVIFIGDAQHAMSPFAGNGANMAMMDGYQLAEQMILAKHLSTAVQAYDDLCIPRSINAIKMSHRTIAIGHSQGIWKYMWVTMLKIVAYFFGFNSKSEQ